jgi:hypothetical protein
VVQQLADSVGRVRVNVREAKPTPRWFLIAGGSVMMSRSRGPSGEGERALVPSRLHDGGQAVRRGGPLFERNGNPAEAPDAQLINQSLMLLGEHEQHIVPPSDPRVFTSLGDAHRLARLI